MLEERRRYLKMTLGAGVLGIGTLLSAKCGSGSDKPDLAVSNGVVTGVSPKKEILYKKTKEWEMYYKAAY